MGEREILVNWRWADITGITVWDRFFSMVPICAAEYQEKRHTLAATKKYLQTAGKKSALDDGSPVVTINTYRPFRYFF